MATGGLHGPHFCLVLSSPNFNYFPLGEILRSRASLSQGKIFYLPIFCFLNFCVTLRSSMFSDQRIKRNSTCRAPGWLEFRTTLFISYKRGWGNPLLYPTNTNLWSRENATNILFSCKGFQMTFLALWRAKLETEGKNNQHFPDVLT